MPHTISTFFQYIRESLYASHNYSLQEAGYQARMILEFLYQERWQVLFGKDNMPVSDEMIAKADSFIQQLLAYHPIQYVLGEAYFYERRFTVNEHVLIPRGETEELMLWVVEAVKATKGPCKILDIGTGSGCIPISIYLELESSRVAHFSKASHAPRIIELEIAGIDISEQALEVARKNASDLKANVSFSQLDILNATAETLGKWDIIVSNPPYVPLRDYAEMESHVKDFEPHIALFVSDNDPLIFYRTIATLGRQALNENGLLFFEIYADYALEIVKMLEEMGYKQVICKEDIHGKLRIIKCEK